MDYEHFTLKTQDALQDASALAQKNDHSEIGLEHLLSALLNQKDGIVVPIIERVGVNVQSLQKHQAEEGEEEGGASPHSFCQAGQCW